MFDDFIKALGQIIRQRPLVIKITLGFTVAALIISLIIPPTFTATITLMPPTSQGMNLMALAFQGGVLAEPEIGGTGYMPGMVTPSEVFAYMLKSGTITSMVIQECSLIDHYKLSNIFKVKPDKANYLATKQLGLVTKIEVTDEKFIKISVKDKNKKKAAEIANCYASSLNRVYAKMNMTQGGKMREFIEKRLKDEAVTLAIAEESLRVFQARHKIVSLDEEMAAVINIASRIQGNIIQLKSELEFLRESYTEDDPKVIAAKIRISKLEDQLREMESGKQGSLFTKLSQAPGVAMELGRRVREVKIHTEIYTLLCQQLEQAKILEAKDTPKVQVLEEASPPYRKSWPKRSLIVIFGMLFGFLCSIVSIIFMMYWNEYQAAPEKYPKLDLLIKTLRVNLPVRWF